MRIKGSNSHLNVKDNKQKYSNFKRGKVVQ